MNFSWFLLALACIGHSINASTSTRVRVRKTFITDKCSRDGACESGCCGFRTGFCAGPIVAIERDGGCGFGDFVSNCNAAKKLGFKNITACTNRRV